MTTPGTVTEYTVPTANVGPASITTGPDRNLWVTYNNVNKVATVTTG
ncbi:hypothetical protein [Kitasatospora sp. MAP5-34]|nr:hypothetical protein [Kitasatospora sp. MAP5-34]MDH6580690.1 hypothetical protein [Kitasatospora sp. MAP5-34]